MSKTTSIEELQAWISVRFGVQVLPHTPFSEAGVDSLDLVEVQIMLEERGLKISDEEMAEAKSLNDLMNIIQTK